MRTLRNSLAILLSAAAFGAELSAQKAWTHPTLGFAITPPKGWIWQPPKDDRGQVVAAFAAPRAQAPKVGRPHVSTIRILKLAARAQQQDVEGLPAKVPFHDLESWVKGAVGDGTNIAERAEGKLGDFAGQRFMVQVLRRTERRNLIGGIVEVGDHELMVVADVSESHVDDLRKALELSFASLSAAKAKGEGDRPEAPWNSDADGWAAKDAEAKQAARKEFAEAVVQTVDPKNEPGWKGYRSKVFTVISAAGSSETKKAVTAAEVAHKWCKGHFEDVSEREQLPAVLRIFSSPEHYADFQSASGKQREFDPDRRELYYYEDPNFGTGDGYGMLFRAVFWHWIEDEAPGVQSVLPRWLETGIWEYFRSTRLKGRKILFSSSDVETGRIRHQKRNESMPPLWALIQESMQPSPEGGLAEERWGYTPECARLVRWLIDHDGDAAFGEKDVLAKYFNALAETAATVGPDPTLRVNTAILIPEQVTQMRKMLYTWRDQALKATNDRALPLEVDPWNAVNAKWLAFNEKYK